MLILRHDEQGCDAVHAHVLTWISMVPITKLDLIFKYNQGHCCISRGVLLWYIKRLYVP